MKEDWLSFTDWSVRAIMEGRKTQTRRPMKEQPYRENVWWVLKTKKPMRDSKGDVCSELRTNDLGYIKQTLDLNAPASPGDVMCVREALVRGGDSAFYRTDGEPVNDGLDSDVGLWRWKRDVLPARFMPYDYCRTKVPLLRLWAEQLGDISEEDAIAEGIVCLGLDYYHGAKVQWTFYSTGAEEVYPTAQDAYFAKYQEIYKRLDLAEWVWRREWA